LRTVIQGDPYTLLKRLTRGKTITQEDLLQFINRLEVSPKIKAQLKGLQVTSYIGDAVRICEKVLELAKQELD
jgi:adenylosuccinate lyase